MVKIDEADVVNPPNNNQQVTFSVLRYKPTPDSLGGVHDIDTDELLIPRIAPPLTLQDPATVSNKALAANVATLTTSAAHNLTVGAVVDVTGVDAVFNGRYTVTGSRPRPSATPRPTPTSSSAAATGTVTHVDPARPESEVDYPDMDRGRAHPRRSVGEGGGGTCQHMIERIRRMALPIAITSLVVNIIVTVISFVLWYLAIVNDWLESVMFVSNVSMLALVFAGISGVAAGLAGILSLVPTDDIVDAVTGDD